MEKVELDTVLKLVTAIKDEGNPQAQLEAVSARDRWLAEVDAGTLEMSDEARITLEAG